MTDPAGDGPAYAPATESAARTADPTSPRAVVSRRSVMGAAVAAPLGAGTAGASSLAGTGTTLQAADGAVENEGYGLGGFGEGGFGGGPVTSTPYSDDTVPGPGILGALAGVSVVGYLLARASTGGPDDVATGD